jgi:hypothetical protein
MSSLLNSDILIAPKKCRPLQPGAQGLDSRFLRVGPRSSLIFKLFMRPQGKVSFSGQFAALRCFFIRGGT